MSAKTLFLAWQDNEPGQGLEMTIPDKPTISKQKYRLTIQRAATPGKVGRSGMMNPIT